MRRRSLDVIAALLAASLPLLTAQQSPGGATEGAAKDPLVESRAKLKAALERSADLDDTGFEVRWGPAEKGDDARDDPLQVFITNQRGGAPGGATGSFHDGRLDVTLTGDEGDRFILRGSHMIARDDQREWCLRRGHYADGNQLLFLPDPRALLQQLADWDLAVTHREAGALDDRPVEVVSVTLNAEQFGELVWSGVLPGSLAHGVGNVFRLAIAGGKAGRKAAEAPTSILDLAISIDPGTRLVHEVRARCWTDSGKNGNVFVFPAGKVRVAAGGGQVIEAEAKAKEPEDEGDAAPAADEPLRYEHGLPMRPRKGMSVVDFTLRLRDHGARAPAPLDERQRRLLGVR